MGRGNSRDAVRNLMISDCLDTPDLSAWSEKYSHAAKLNILKDPSRGIPVLVEGRLASSFSIEEIFKLRKSTNIKLKKDSRLLVIRERQTGEIVGLSITDMQGSNEAFRTFAYSTVENSTFGGMIRIFRCLVEHEIRFMPDVPLIVDRFDLYRKYLLWLKATLERLLKEEAMLGISFAIAQQLCQAPNCNLPELETKYAGKLWKTERSS